MRAVLKLWWKNFSSNVCQWTRQKFLPYIHSSHHTSGPRMPMDDLICVFFLSSTLFPPVIWVTQCQAKTSKQIKSDAIRQSREIYWPLEDHPFPLLDPLQVVHLCVWHLWTLLTRINQPICHNSVWKVLMHRFENCSQKPRWQLFVAALRASWKRI